MSHSAALNVINTHRTTTEESSLVNKETINPIKSCAISDSNKKKEKEIRPDETPKSEEIKKPQEE